LFIGGADEELGGLLGSALTDSGFHILPQPNPDLRGLEPSNLCNRGRSAQGVQLELCLALRKTMFQSLTRRGRRYPCPPFEAFTAAVARTLNEQRPRLHEH